MTSQNPPTATASLALCAGATLRATIATVEGPAVKAHPLVVACDVLKPCGSSLLDGVHLEPLGALHFKDVTLQQGAVVRPIVIVPGPGVGERITTPVHPGSTAFADREPKSDLAANRCGFERAFVSHFRCACGRANSHTGSRGSMLLLVHGLLTGAG
eukprot:CAMPEP_0114307332 /NCGR_PEP_ID=MMETSP0059-20121206/17411_1 /TAXON_ID=36894 /ORGANISM="Pyramimonas parkeae, Strain CCMP726" /LENGTH=156 /DNA_ID=CAMNT_0001430785 /DNA_START=241 /DNA_END=708 /DNA_ORIENTATION=-